MTVHWYPGHMAKAFRLIESELKKVDFVIECRDARAPLSTRNPVLDKNIDSKPRLVLLLKKDLADTSMTDLWIQKIEDEGHHVLALNTLKDPVFKLINSIIPTVLKDKREREKRRGMKRRPDRALIVGVPNVGKSTVINTLSKRSSAKVENRPGVTQALKQIQINKFLSLVDSPGVLWPKFETEEMGIHCALVGSVKNTGFEEADVLDYAFKSQGIEKEAYIMDFAKRRGYLTKDGKYDIKQAEKIYLQELQNGEHGRITWDQV